MPRNKVKPANKAVSTIPQPIRIIHLPKKYQHNAKSKEPLLLGEKKLITLNENLLVVTFENSNRGHYAVIDLNKKTFMLHRVNLDSTFPPHNRSRKLHLSQKLEGEGVERPTLVMVFEHVNHKSHFVATINLANPSFPKFNYNYWDDTYLLDCVFILKQRELILSNNDSINYCEITRPYNNIIHHPRTPSNFLKKTSSTCLINLAYSKDCFAVGYGNGYLDIRQMNGHTSKRINFVKIFNSLPIHAITEITEDLFVLESLMPYAQYRDIPNWQPALAVFNRATNKVDQYDVEQTGIATTKMPGSDQHFIRYVLDENKKCVLRFETISNPQNLINLNQHEMAVLEEDEILIFSKYDLYKKFLQYLYLQQTGIDLVHQQLLSFLVEDPINIILKYVGPAYDMRLFQPSEGKGEEFTLSEKNEPPQFLKPFF